MRYFWLAINVLIIAFTGWTGIWGTAPERLHDTGFSRSLVAVGPNEPPLWIVAIIVSLMSAGYTFFAMRRAALDEATFRFPSLDRSPFRHRSDPLQNFGIAFMALLSCAMAATVRFFVAPSLGLGPVLFVWSWAIATGIGGLLGYAMFRPRDVV